MNGHYILIGQTPVPIEVDPYTPEGIRGLLEWAEWFETSSSERVVCQTKLLGIVFVSTVFLGLDHAWMGGPPMLFETMAFWRGGEDGEGYEQQRCSTWLEAEEQHRRVCREVTRPRALASWVARAWAACWKRARTTRR
jgi:hypothetical protein